MSHFIKKALKTCQDHYEKMDPVLRVYDKQFQEIGGNPRYTPEYKATMCHEIKEKRTAYCMTEAADLSDKLKAVFQEERNRITEIIAGKLPSQEQVSALAILRNRKDISQAEFDAYAGKMKGVYMAEKELTEIAKERNLIAPAFFNLDKQLERVKKVEAWFLPDACYYTGQKVEPVRLNGITYSTENSGTPYIVQYTEKHMEEMIRDYEDHSFQPEPEAPSYYERLQTLIKKYPDKEKDIQAFIQANRQKLSNEIFADEFNDFMLGIRLEQSSKSDEDLDALLEELKLEFGDGTVARYFLKHR